MGVAVQQPIDSQYDLIMMMQVYIDISGSTYIIAHNYSCNITLPLSFANKRGMQLFTLLNAAVLRSKLAVFDNILSSLC